MKRTMDDDLSQADLSNLSLKDMTPAQRAEMRRRYDDFMKTFKKDAVAPTPMPAGVRKWVPGMKK